MNSLAAFSRRLFFSALSVSALGATSLAADEAKTGDALFAKPNLAAWCIVPYDGKKRGPEERAAMLERLGLKLFVYDYRAQHIPTFDAEMEALKRHKIELLGWWFPQTLNAEAKQILEVLRRHGMNKCDLWVTGGGAATKTPEEHAQRVEAEAARLRPLAKAAAELGVRVGLYNHGGWFGEPENQIAVIEQLRREGITNTGIVYNLHHAHGQMERLPALLTTIKPYLLCLNLNGMNKNGEAKGEKILPLGAGELDLTWFKIVRDSGYSGPIGILNHTDEDAEARLQDNIDGLNYLAAQSHAERTGQATPPPPAWRSWKAAR